MAKSPPWSQRLWPLNLAPARQAWLQLFPGVGFCLLVVMAANYLTEHYGSTPILAALLLGMAFNCLSKNPEFTPGLDFCSTRLLRLGVALLGVRITFAQMQELGLQPVLVVGAVVIATLGFSLLLGWLFKLDRMHAIISGAAAAICGASAALAVASVLTGRGTHDKHLLCTLVCVTSLSTLAMFIYPALFSSLGLDTQQIGVFLGASIHDVAQVVGAGHMISPAVAELATYTKMLRVATLVPVIALLAWLLPAAGVRPTRRNCLPPFLIAFVALVVVSSLGWIPAAASALLTEFSQLCLWAAMAALGTKIHPTELWQVGRTPFLLLLANTIFIAALAYALVR